MNNILNQLIQLQELNFAKEEQKASNSQMPLEELEKSIARIRGNACPRWPSATIACRSTTRWRWSPSRMEVVRGAAWPCPSRWSTPPRPASNCSIARIAAVLSFPDTVARQPKKKLDTKRPVEVGIARFSAATLMVPKLAATTREEVIGELAKLLGDGGFVEEPATLTELALRREAIVSTAVEHGLAFPHVRDVEGGGLTFAVGMKEKGIKFGAHEDHLSKIFFFIVIPTAATAFYLRLLAGLARTFESTDARKELLDCDTPDQMWNTLVKLTKSAVP